MLILLGVALGLTSYLVDAQIPEALARLGAGAHPLAVRRSCWRSTAPAVLGSVLEIYSAIVVLAPLVVPLGAIFNVDPVHLGVVFLAESGAGFLLSADGAEPVLSAQRFGKPLPFLYKQALPFLLIMALGVLFITYVPALTTGVANFFSHH